MQKNARIICLFWESGRAQASELRGDRFLDQIYIYCGMGKAPCGWLGYTHTQDRDFFQKVL